MNYELFTWLNLPAFSKNNIVDLLDVDNTKVISPGGTTASKFDSNINFTFLDSDANSNKNICLPSYIRWPIKNPLVVQDWVTKNVPELRDTKLEIGYQEIKHTVESESESTVTPHTDGPGRKFVLMYLFSTGNDSSNVDTVWWSKEDQTDSPHRGMLHFQGLTQIATATFPAEQWVLIYTHKLHSVHNITGNRKSLTIGFNDDHVFNELIKKYG